MDSQGSLITSKGKIAIQNLTKKLIVFIKGFFSVVFLV